jgi:hypothetical protein
LALAAALACGLATQALAQTAAPATATPSYTPANADGQIEVVLQNHRFSPAEIHVPANTRTVLLIKNMDDTADEFDSSSLKVEKVIAGGGQGTVRLRALPPGSYPFMGEFHSDTAQGVVIAE